MASSHRAQTGGSSQGSASNASDSTGGHHSSGPGPSRTGRTSTVVFAAREAVSSAATKQSVEAILRSILKRNPPTDRRTLLQTLEQAFPAQEARSATSGSGLPVAGIAQATALPTAQASLYLRARAALNECTPRLRALKPQGAADLENIEAYREVTLSVFNKLVDELGRAEGPNIRRVDNAFEDLLGKPSRKPDEKPEPLLEKFRKELQLTDETTVTSEERENWLSFRLISDHLSTLRHSWGEWKQSQRGDPLQRVDRLLRTFAQLDQAVNDLEGALDSAGVPAAEREAIKFDLENPAQAPPDPLTLQQLLQWTHDIAGDEGPTVVRAAGTKGVAFFSELLINLDALWRDAFGVEQGHDASFTFPDPRMDTDDVQLRLQLVLNRLESAAEIASGQTRDKWQPSWRIQRTRGGQPRQP